ncbi:MAG: YqgE/AlgH family protein [Bacteroidales bacterium]|nr:YqgE/AlgH family protein [Bacteroidales bacterium]
MEPIFKTYKKPQSGLLLLSDPFLKDIYFSRSVVLLAEHNAEGSFGLILNKPIDIPVNDLIPDFPAFDSKVYMGGPVKPDNVFFLHSLGNLIEDSIKIKNNLYFGGDVERVKELILLDKIKPNEIKFFIGYSGWTPNQLEDELKEKSWLLVDSKNQNLMDNIQQILWKNILQKMGSKYFVWSVAPIDPQLN